MSAFFLLAYNPNNMQIQKIIEQLGYTSKEAKIYLTSLSMGDARISDIAKKVGLPRTSVQITAEKLRKDGLMNFYIMKRYKYWVPAKPERLLVILKRQEDMIKEALPHLTNLKRKGRSLQKKAEQDLSLGLLRMLADSSTEPILITNEAIEIQYVNTAWEEEFGYTLEEVVGKHSRILKSEKTPEETYMRMWNLLKQDRLFQTDHMNLAAKGGKILSIVTTIFPVRHNGNLFYIQILDDMDSQMKSDEIRKKFVQVGGY